MDDCLVKVAMSRIRGFYEVKLLCEGLHFCTICSQTYNLWSSPEQVEFLEPIIHFASR